MIFKQGTRLNLGIVFIKNGISVKSSELEIKLFLSIKHKIYSITILSNLSILIVLLVSSQPSKLNNEPFIQIKNR